MKKRIVQLFLTLTVVGATLLTAGCGKKEQTAAQGDSDGQKVITALVSSDLKPEEADTISGINEDFRLFEMVFDPLVRYGEGGEIEPALAESWEISEDGKSYTFHLRKDVKFSDGTKFNADNVIFNASRWDEKQTFSAKLLDVKKVDDYTVTFEFDQVAYPCLIEFTYPRPYRMLGENGVDEEGNFKEMIGTGQWMIESYKTNQEVVLVPNPNYYADAPKVDKVVLKLVDDGQARTMALQSGEVDICLADLPTESWPVIEQDENLEEFEAHATQTYYLILNYENEFLKD